MQPNHTQRPVIYQQLTVRKAMRTLALVVTVSIASGCASSSPAVKQTPRTLDPIPGDGTSQGTATIHLHRLNDNHGFLSKIVDRGTGIQKNAVIIENNNRVGRNLVGLYRYVDLNNDWDLLAAGRFVLVIGIRSGDKHIMLSRDSSTNTFSRISTDKFQLEARKVDEAREVEARVHPNLNKSQMNAWLLNGWPFPDWLSPGSELTWKRAPGICRLQLFSSTQPETIRETSSLGTSTRISRSTRSWEGCITPNSVLEPFEVEAGKTYDITWSAPGGWSKPTVRP